MTTVTIVTTEHADEVKCVVCGAKKYSIYSPYMCYKCWKNGNGARVVKIAAEFAQVLQNVFDDGEGGGNRGSINAVLVKYDQLMKDKR